MKLESGHHLGSEACEGKLVRFVAMAVRMDIATNLLAVLQTTPPHVAPACTPFSSTQVKVLSQPQRPMCAKDHANAPEKRTKLKPKFCVSLQQIC
eukprot:612514-Amphidinium_carterae.5